jgi:tRNA threonylcarbamoyl adenosine modification protein YeaZ
MITLAIETSSPTHSLSLYRGRTRAAGVVWRAAPREHHRLFDELRRLLEETGATPADLTAAVVGRGPGNYSGLRIALTLAEALLLPGGGAPQAVCSGAAMAWAALRQPGEGPVAVAGDARRGQVWHAVFGRDARGAMDDHGGWRLCPPGELAARLPPGTRLVSPDPDALRPLLGSTGLMLDPDLPASVTADDVFGLWTERTDSGAPGEPATPIYLHPAV